MCTQELETAEDYLEFEYRMSTLTLICGRNSILHTKVEEMRFLSFRTKNPFAWDRGTYNSVSSILQTLAVHA
jgi:hypothetical protein